MTPSRELFPDLRLRSRFFPDSATGLRCKGPPALLFRPGRNLAGLWHHHHHREAATIALDMPNHSNRSNGQHSQLAHKQTTHDHHHDDPMTRGGAASAWNGTPRATWLPPGLPTAPPPSTPQAAPTASPPSAPQLAPTWTPGCGRRARKGDVLPSRDGTRTFRFTGRSRSRGVRCVPGTPADYAAVSRHLRRCGGDCSGCRILVGVSHHKHSGDLRVLVGSMTMRASGVKLRVRDVRKRCAAAIRACRRLWDRRRAQEKLRDAS